MALLPQSVQDAFDRASPRERALLQWTAVIVVLAVLYVLAWPPLAQDIVRTRDVLARDRATLATLKTYAEAPAATRTAEAPLLEPQAALTRALDARGLRGAASQIEAREGRVVAVLPALSFDTLVALLDDLSRNDRLRVLDARVTARVEPGTVRAELTLGR
jgi:type II secretory pathway component PulM